MSSLSVYLKFLLKTGKKMKHFKNRGKQTKCESENENSKTLANLQKI